MANEETARSARHLDGLADQRERHRVAIGLEAHEVILGHAPGLARLEAEARLARRRDEGGMLAGKAIDRSLVGRPVDAHVRDVALPLAKLIQQVLVIDESPAREEISLEVLHPRFH